MESGSDQSWNISVDSGVKFLLLVFNFQVQKKSFRSGLITDNVGYQNEILTSSGSHQQ